ncbi:beta-sarcoglycan [Sitophilus oryzae]|uniref:Beta-sarcoglycan n=1 Tax=Sitophilus oryzae TaxID=7048 RepID=A0A6J2Y5G6_SITOR|nr:beta-sarcoglycan [Sitophilus oryzae]
MNDYVIASPQHSTLSDDNDASSSRETALLNNGNSSSNKCFKTAYVAPAEKQKKPVARGRKTFAFWTLVCLLFLLAIGNLILTMTILGVLKLGNGMQSIELLPKEGFLKMFGNVDLDHIYKQDGKIEGFDDENVEVTTDDGSIMLNLYTKTNRVVNKLQIDNNETVFKGFNKFVVKNKQQDTIFDLTNPVFNNVKNVYNFNSKIVETNTVRSPLKENLKIEGESVHLNGAEGTKLEAREIVWSADQDIYLKAKNGSIVLSGKEGTYIDVRRIPIAKLDKKNYVTAQFKICVCMPQGKLFRVPVANANDPVYCHHVDMSPQHNPCM